MRSYYGISFVMVHYQITWVLYQMGIEDGLVNNNLSLNDAYFYGYKKLKEVLIWLLELGVKNITVFALSTENCEKRKQSELSIVTTYIKRGLQELLEDPIVDRYEVKVSAIGKLDKLPKDLTDYLNKVIEKTSNYDKRKLTLAICYGGRQEILDAVVGF